MSRLHPETSFHYRRSNGATLVVVAVGIVVPGLAGSREFAPEAAQVENLHLTVFTRAGNELALEDLPESEWIREAAEDALIEEALGQEAS